MNAIVSSRLAHYELLSSLGTILLARGRPAEGFTHQI